MSPPAPVAAPEPAGSAPQAALPSQGPPGRTIDALRSRLSNLGVPETAFRIGPPAGRAWTMEQTEDGWRVGWYDRAFVAPAMFEDVADASAFLLGKLMMDAERNRGVAGPVHVMPVQHPMIGDRLGSEDADKNALGSDEPMRAERGAGGPAAGGRDTPPPPGYAPQADGFGHSYVPDADYAEAGSPDGFGPGVPDGFGPGFGPGGGGAPDYGQPEPESGRHGRHGRHDADPPGNGRSPHGHPDELNGIPGRPEPAGVGQADGFERPGPGMPDGPGFDRPDAPFRQQREPLGASPRRFRAGADRVRAAGRAAGRLAAGGLRAAGPGLTTCRVRAPRHGVPTRRVPTPRHGAATRWLRAPRHGVTAWRVRAPGHGVTPRRVPRPGHGAAAWRSRPSRHGVTSWRVRAPGHGITDPASTVPAWHHHPAGSTARSLTGGFDRPAGLPPGGSTARMPRRR